MVAAFKDNKLRVEKGTLINKSLTTTKQTGAATVGVTPVAAPATTPKTAPKGAQPTPFTKAILAQQLKSAPKSPKSGQRPKDAKLMDMNQLGSSGKTVAAQRKRVESRSTPSKDTNSVTQSVDKGKKR